MIHFNLTVLNKNYRTFLNRHRMMDEEGDGKMFLMRCYYVNFCSFIFTVEEEKLFYFDEKEVSQYHQRRRKVRKVSHCLLVFLL